MPGSRENHKDRSVWQRVTAAHPCPVCGKVDYCTVTADGRLAKCMRVEAGAFRTGRDKNGAPYHLHRLKGQERPAFELPPRTRSAGAQRANPDILHAVYDALLGGLILSADHREQLHRRGLTDAEIDRRLYRSLGVHGRAAKARALGERFGVEALLSVPGFALRNKNGRQYVTIAGKAGLLVPVRDTFGRITALKVRRDDGDDGPRYSYLTSAKDSGPGPGAPVHAPLGTPTPCPCLRLTEGELKADVATVLSGQATLGLPGVAHWQAALPLLRELQTTTVRIAFDADAADKPNVARSLAAAVEDLAAAGFAVAVERWDATHKGIDDALAAAVAVEVLTGDEARAYVAEVLVLATAGEPPSEPNPLDRLGDVLAESGVEGLYGDGQLLDALARLAETNPAGFAARKNQLKREGISIRDFDKALASRRAAVRAELPPRVLQAGYRVAAGRLVRDNLTPQGAVEVPLANFTARIVAETTIDDGSGERSARLTVEGQLCDGRQLPRVEVPIAEFAGLDWILPAWGARAVVYAGRGTADHLRAAIQLLSADVTTRTVYSHLGWRRIGEQWRYLHAGGAIGEDGPVEGVEVSPGDSLSRYNLPAPPTGEQLRRAVRASLSLLDFGPPHLAFPLLAAVYRAVLGGTDFALHLAGQSGVFKTELSALLQQHYGVEMDARRLPASWASTGNSLEAIAFAAKDALLVVDDFAPSGSAADVARLHREAERLLRAQGNNAGRQRMRADGSLRPEKPPRGLILSTGEDVPRVQSLRARLLVLEASKGDFGPPPPAVNSDLTLHQRNAAEGLYAASMSGFVRWLAPRYEDVRRRLAVERSELRQRAAGDGQHARTPGIVADLALGLRYLLEFAEASGALAAAERAPLWERGWTALCAAGAAQVEQGRAADPVEQFLRLLAAALASGRAHVAAVDGGFPDAPAAWGWRRETIRGETEWRAQGRRMGWVDGDALYLEPEASYAAAQEMAGAQGESLPVSAQTLRRRLKGHGLLASTDTKRETLTIRRVADGAARNVLHLDSSRLCAKPDKPDIDGGSSGEMSGYECRVAVQDGQNPASDPTEKTGGNGQNVGFVGLDSGREPSRNGNKTAPYLAPGLSEDDARTPFDDGA